MKTFEVLDPALLPHTFSWKSAAITYLLVDKFHIEGWWKVSVFTFIGITLLFDLYLISKQRYARPVLFSPKK